MYKNLQEKTVACLLLNGSSNSLGVGHKQIVPDNLDLGTGRQLGIAWTLLLVHTLTLLLMPYLPSHLGQRDPQWKRPGSHG